MRLIVNGLLSVDKLKPIFLVVKRCLFIPMNLSAVRQDQNENGKESFNRIFSLACGINPAENGNYIIDSPHDLGSVA